MNSSVSVCHTQQNRAIERSHTITEASIEMLRLDTPKEFLRWNSSLLVVSAWRPPYRLLPPNSAPLCSRLVRPSAWLGPGFCQVQLPSISPWRRVKLLITAFVLKRSRRFCLRVLWRACGQSKTSASHLVARSSSPGWSIRQQHWPERRVGDAGAVSCLPRARFPRCCSMQSEENKSTRRNGQCEHRRQNWP